MATEPVGAGQPPCALGLRLYFVAGAPNSERALANLRALLVQRGLDDCHPELVDVAQEPARALREGILLTPTLIRFSPQPRVSVVGDLGNLNEVARALGL